MKTNKRGTNAAAGILALTLFLGPAVATADHGEEGEDHAHHQKTPVEQMAELEGMCADSADARAQRHQEVTLYERLGGHDRLVEMVTRIVDNHLANEEIGVYFQETDREALIGHVVDFMGAGTGGTETYTGRDMPATHAGMNIDEAQFLAAGGDIVMAMQSMDYGQDEINEVVCILVSLKDQVLRQ